MSLALREKELIQHQLLRRVRLRHILALLLLGIFLMASFLYNQNQHELLKEDFKIINISGRQRLLSQQIAHAVGQRDFETLSQARKEFSRGLIFLTTTRFLGHNYPEIKETFDHPEGIRSLSNRLLVLLEEDLDRVGYDKKVFELVSALVTQFDAATSLIQKTSEAEYERRRTNEILILISTLMLLLIEAFFIFRPTLREISLSYEKLNSLEDRALENSRLALIGESASSIGHEVSNPLLVISATAESILHSHKKALPDEIVKKIETILKQAENISRIVSALKVQARKTINDPFEKSLILPIVLDALEMFLTRIRHKGITISIIETDRLEINCKRSAISQVIANLISNAIDAVSMADEKTIKIEILKIDSRPTIRISDSGPGVPAEMRESIFEAFVTTKNDGKGTGLGLAISRRIITEHGGTIKLNHEVSNSCFEISFPA